MVALKELKEAFSAFGSSEASILAILLVGSYARNEQRPDSDVDIVIVSEEKNVLLSSIDWLERIGLAGTRSSDVAVERYGEITSLRFFQGDTEYEIGIGSQNWIKLPFDQGTRRVLEDGYIVLYEKDGALDKVKRIIVERPIAG